jgi:tryptophan-rich sensory protein
MNWLLLAVFIVVCELVGLAGSIFTVRAIPTWYARLKKPTFNPPNWVFGPAWTMLYALQGIAACLIFQAGGYSLAFIIFIIQLFLNALWTPLFFGAKRIGAALFELIILLIFIIATIVLFFGIDVLAAWLMMPYFFWVIFATTLNYRIWWLNS